MENNTLIDLALFQCRNYKNKFLELKIRKYLT